MVSENNTVNEELQLLDLKILGQSLTLKFYKSK